MPANRPRRRRVHWAAYLWPGLPHLWIRGSVAGLSLALAFSVLLNVLILATLVWPEWLESRVKFGCGLCAAALWLAALWETRCELRRIAEARHASEENNDTDPAPEERPNDTLLRRAQTHYLREEWVEAERELRAAIRRDRRDVEANLWYATLLRRTGRDRKAVRRLRRLELLDDAKPWRHEIGLQLERIPPPKEPAATPSVAEPPETSDPSGPTQNEQPTVEMRRAA